MKPCFVLMSFIGLMFFSCSKTNCDVVSPTISGTWKMVQVKTYATNSVETKPSSIPGDVIITFVPGNGSIGSFKGNTPTNVFGPNGYSLGANQSISMPVMSMTKIAETSWGTHFVDNIREAHLYNFELDGKLNIFSLQKTLTFIKQ